MATTAAPYGLRPIRRSDGMPYAGSTNQYLIDPAGEGTNLFYGQAVIIGADGYIALATGSGADLTSNSISGTSGVGAIGVFVGCEYVNSSGQLMQVLGNSKSFFEGQKNLNDIQGFFTDNAIPDAELTTNNIAQYFLFGGSDVLMDEMIMQQWQK